MVRLLFRNGTDINMKVNGAALSDIFRTRRDCGAVVGEWAGYQREKYNHEGTALHFAVEKKSQRMVQFLLKNGANVN